MTNASALRLSSLLALAVVAASSEQLILNAAFIVAPPFISSNEDGLLFDLFDKIKDRAASDDIELILNFATDRNFTYNGALDDLTLPEDDESSLDIVIGDFFMTTERTQRVTFTPSYLASYVSTIKLIGGAYNSIDEANAGNGSVCAVGPETALFGALSSVVDTLVPCGTVIAECIVALKHGQCDLIADDVLHGMAAIEADGTGTLVATEERVLDDFSFHAWPMRSSLEPRVIQLMSTWMYDIIETDAVDDLVDMYFGAGAAMQPIYPESITLSSAVMRSIPFAYQNGVSNWQGYLIDTLEVLEKIAQKDGVDLTINVDFQDGVLTDREGDAGTYDGALGVLEGERTYDMILGDYYHTSPRAQRVTFAPSHLTSFITTFRLVGGEFDSLDSLISGGGILCLWENTAMFDTISPLLPTDDILPCGPTFEECFALLKDGQCDLNADDIVYGRLAIASDPDIVANGDQPADEMEYFAFPYSSLLPVSTQVLMTKWVHDARAAGDFETLEQEWIIPSSGGEDGDMDGDIVDTSGATGTLGKPKLLFTIGSISMLLSSVA